MAQRKRNSGKIRDLELVAGVVDLTGATADYPLSVNETAKINITAASTPLNIAVEDGVYELHIIIDPETFAADSNANLQLNGADQTGEIYRNTTRISESIATDEIDTDFSNADDRFYFVYDLGRICSIRATLHKRSSDAYCHNSTILYTLPGGVALLHTDDNKSYWPSASDWTSMGNLVFTEAATGVCYVKRIA